MWHGRALSCRTWKICRHGGSIWPKSQQALRTAIRESGVECPSESHIIPLVVGANEKAIWKALQMQEHGFYVLPVRPPTVPEGTARLRFADFAD